MPLISYTIVCTHKKLVAPGVYELKFTKPAGFTHKPGQFVLFDTPLVSNTADIQPRAYSLASIAEEPELLFVVKTKKNGRFSNWLEQRIDVGVEMGMKGPFGLFLLKDSANTVMFAATGAGLAPFRAQILAALKKNDPRKFHLFFGVRDEKDLFWTDEISSWQKEFPNFKLHLCLSGENPMWTGNKGRIQAFMPDVIADHLKTDLYICGAPEMVKDIKTLALEGWKFPKANVHAEGYI